MKYLLDTNVISSLIKFPHGSAAKRVAALQVGELGTSIIVSAELKFGCTKKGSKQLSELVEETLRSFEVAPWGAPADNIYGQVRTHLELRGKPIGQNDVLIAAHALALKAVLVPDNEREFSLVPGLKVENWLRL